SELHLVNQKPFYYKQQKDNNDQKNPQKDTASQHFQELTKVAEKAHEELVKHNSPYRFCIYKENNNIFIDIVLLNNENTIIKITKKNISLEYFSHILEEIHQGKGLFIEKTI
ncbi:hypothetical protein BVX93_01030, partial [bacterium B13(2017)]